MGAPSFNVLVVEEMLADADVFTEFSDEGLPAFGKGAIEAVSSSQVNI